MKKILLALLMCISISAFAGRKQLSNGSVAFWDDNTPVIEWNSCRIPIQLTDKCDFNVWGTVYLTGQSGDTHQRNFIIKAGETNGYADFEGLKNGCRYYIKVVINN